jgi:general secretion pathway protein L
MATLVVQIPKRARVRGAAIAPLPGAATAPQDYEWASSLDGLTLSAHGRSPARRLPKADAVVAVLADADVSWHHITLPKAPAPRLRAALGGVLEEALLEEVDDVHLAVAPQAQAGQPTWIAVVSRRWLRAELAELAQAEVFVDRVVPASAPDDPPVGHFALADSAGADGAVELHWADRNGVASLRLKGGLARALLPRPAPPDTRWSATPAAATAAERWLGGPVRVLADGERLLQSARSLWNLRQFDLARHTRGARALRDIARRFFGREWRTVRYGLGVLVAAQLLGLNLWAWHLSGAIDARRMALQSLVRSSFPNVNPQDVQRDAQAVMDREMQALRSAAGQVGDTDLESMLQAAASAWPADRPAAEGLRFEPGQLTLSVSGWTDAQVGEFRSLLGATGWSVDAAPGRVTLVRARAGRRS